MALPDFSNMQSGTGFMQVEGGPSITMDKTGITRSGQFPQNKLSQPLGGNLNQMDWRTRNPMGTGNWNVQAVPNRFPAFGQQPQNNPIYNQMRSLMYPALPQAPQAPQGFNYVQPNMDSWRNFG